jgi:hypothetical protein
LTTGELGGGFEKFSHLQQLRDGVPVAAGASGSGGPIQKRGGEFGTANAVGEVDVEFAAMDVHLFRTWIPLL